MAATTQCRYVIWRNEPAPDEPSIPEVLSRFSSVDVVRSNDDSAVILADDESLEALRAAMPELTIEQDFRFRLVSG